MKYMSITFQHIMEMSMIHILSSIISLGDRFHMSRKGGTGSHWEVSGFPRSVNGMAMSELDCRKHLVGIGLANSVICSINLYCISSSSIQGPFFSQAGSSLFKRFH